MRLAILDDDMKVALASADWGPLRSRGVEKELFATSDFVSIHVVLSDRTRGLLRNAEFQKRLRGVGQDPAWQDTPELFYEFLRIEAAKWAKAGADSGAQVQ